MKEITLKVEGMMCKGCENRIINSLNDIDGVVEVKANHETGIVLVTSDNNIDENVLKDKINDIGYEVRED